MGGRVGGRGWSGLYLTETGSSNGRWGPVGLGEREQKGAESMDQASAPGSQTTVAPAAAAADGLPPRPPVLSIVTPFYNEEEAEHLFFDRLIPVLEATGLAFEIVCVNDGSRDATLDKLIQRAATDARIRVVDLSRNFGKEAALTAGLDHVQGEAIIPMDADLQDPPELIHDMIAKWRDGWDVVYATRISRQTDTKMKRLTAGGFYRVYNALSKVKMPHNAGDFRLMDRRVVAAFAQLRETNRFNKGLFTWVGFRQTGVDFVREERSGGQSKFNYWKLWNFALDGLTASTTMPLRVSLYMGVAISALAFLYAAILILRTLVAGTDVPGYTSTMVVILLLGGLQMTILGVFGEYLGRMYQEVKRRPVYLVRQTWNIRDDSPVTHRPGQQEPPR